MPYRTGNPIRLKGSSKEPAGSAGACARQAADTGFTRKLKAVHTHDVVLCIQDTTELDFNGQAASGLGPLSYEAQRGMYVHPTYAVSTSREPLGVIDAWMWSRELKDKDGNRAGMKESMRWIEGYERLAEMAEKLPTTRLVYLADREADIMALMVCARDLATPVDWLLRSKHNRTLSGGDKLWSRVTEGESLGEIRFTLPQRQCCT